MESNTMNLMLKRLRACPDAQALATELVHTCTRYGPIRYLKVLMAIHRGRLQALCFWQMGTAAAEQQVMDALSARRVANYLVLVVAMQQPWDGEPPAAPPSSPSWEHALWT